MTALRISVLIVNYNAGARIVRCLRALADQTVSHFEVVLVDNGSADGSLALARDAAGGLDLQVLEAGENLGFAAGNNRAAEIARGEWLALLNPDAYPDPAWLQRLLEAAGRYPDVAAFGSLQIDAADETRLDGCGDVMNASGVYYRGGYGAPTESAPREDAETFAPCAAAALWRAEIFRALGGFDERFFCYGEDVDLAYRHRLEGGRIVQVAAARVLHEGSGLTGRRSGFSVYHGVRNRSWVFVQNTPGWLFPALAPLHIAATALFFLRAVATGSGGAYARAMRDAIAGLPETLKTRRRIQGRRSTSVGQIARAMSWSPVRLLRRAPDLRPFPPHAP
ncbi:MAG: glycosyltransferase family 2 protein [Pseudomonadota bacterium]